VLKPMHMAALCGWCGWHARVLDWVRFVLIAFGQATHAAQTWYIFIRTWSGTGLSSPKAGTAKIALRKSDRPTYRIGGEHVGVRQQATNGYDLSNACGPSCLPSGAQIALRKSDQLGTFGVAYARGCRSPECL